MTMRTVAVVLAIATLGGACRFEPGALRDRDDAGTSPDDATDAPTGDVPIDTTANDSGTDAALDSSLIVCPLSYTLIDNARPASRYRVVTASDDWPAAEADCEDDGGATFQAGHLVVLDNEAERQFVYQQGTTDKWIGASDVNTEGQLQAVTDQPSPYFGNAASQEQSKDCMFTNQNETTMESCNSGFQYICECDGRNANPSNF